MYALIITFPPEELRLNNKDKATAKALPFLLVQKLIFPFSLSSWKWERKKVLKNTAGIEITWKKEVEQAAASSKMAPLGL